MTAAVAVLGLIVIVLLYLRWREASDWAAERQILLERIQRPERVFTGPQPVVKEPLESDEPQMALVGAIVEGEEESA